MRKRFRVQRRGTIRFDPGRGEAEMLRTLARDMVGVLEGQAPDEVRARLYPNAYDDPRADAEFRRLMASDLEARKLADMRTMLATLEGDGPVDLEPDEARAWLGALQDMRLTLGAMLGIEDDGWEDDFADDDPQTALLHFLGYLQDSLVHILM